MAKLHISQTAIEKENLRRYGLRRSFPVLFGAPLAVLFIMALGLAVGSYVHRNLGGTSGAQAATTVIAMGALILGYQQWRSARQEISLDKLYERLDRANRFLCDAPEARQLMDPAWKPECTEEFCQMMYTFMELDNLEYAIEKYGLGFMDSRHAARALSTFKSRCRKSEAFRRLAVKAVAEFGYNITTVAVVNQLANEA